MGLSTLSWLAKSAGSSTPRGSLTQCSVNLARLLAIQDMELLATGEGNVAGGHHCPLHTEAVLVAATPSRIFDAVEAPGLSWPCSPQPAEGDMPVTTLGIALPEPHLYFCIRVAREMSLVPLVSEAELSVWLHTAEKSCAGVL